MRIFDFPSEENKIVLALGAESAGNFSVFKNGKIYFSEDFHDLSDEKNFKNFKKKLLSFLKKENIKPAIIISDLHPLFRTTYWAEKLSQKYQARHIRVQHHYAHVFSSIGDKLIMDRKYKTPEMLYGIALDGTGYGEDDRIWGGELFQLKIKNSKLEVLDRIGSLENQIMLGGELAVKEPARMLISILSDFLSSKEVYPLVKKYYSAAEFKILSAQLKQNFNCLETSGAGRVLDAVSILLGFSENRRDFKHQATLLLEKNSTRPYSDIKPALLKNSRLILRITPLFKYLIQNIRRDKSRLGATAQYYLARGLTNMINKSIAQKNPPVFVSGGLSKNKIISDYFRRQGFYQPQIIPYGDAGLSFGQIFFYLFYKK
ncbi:MAG: hypothetical protein V3574_05740 [Candidatus Moraniibacteriota bacterium]